MHHSDRFALVNIYVNFLQEPVLTHTSAGLRGLLIPRYM